MGKMKDISTSQKETILALLHGGRHSINEIAEQIGVCRRTVQRMKKNGVSISARISHCGRPRCTSVTTDRAIKRNVVATPGISSHQIGHILRNSGVANISHMTVRRRLVEQGVMSFKPKPKPLLTAAMRKKRLVWAKERGQWKIGHELSSLTSQHSSVTQHHILECGMNKAGVIQYNQKLNTQSRLWCGQL
jgi:IS30 family transposase